MSGAPITVTKRNMKRGAWHYLEPALMILLTLPVLYVLSMAPQFGFSSISILIGTPSPSFL